MAQWMEFLKNCGTFYLATTEGNQPRVRPFGAVDEFEGRLYLITSNQKPVFAQLKANAKVEICAMNAEGKWIRVTARAVVDPRKEAKEHMLEANPGLKNMYSADDGKMEVFYLAEGEAVTASFTAAPVTERF